MDAGGVGCKGAMSPQYLMSCWEETLTDQGCNGGSTRTGAAKVFANGFASDVCYPYKGSDKNGGTTCDGARSASCNKDTNDPRWKESGPGTSIASKAYVGGGDSAEHKEMVKELHENGPMFFSYSVTDAFSNFDYAPGKRTIPSSICLPSICLP